MILDPKYYQYVYLIIVTVCTLFCFQSKRDESNKANFMPGLALCIFMIFFIGLRPVSRYFIDMKTYFIAYQESYWTKFNFKAENLLFDNLLDYMSHLGYSVYDFFVLIAAIYFGCMLLACIKLFPRHITLSFLVCLAAFSTFSYGTNGIKAGAAGSIFLLAMAYRRQLLICIPLVLVSWGFHHSMQLPVAAFVLTFFYRNSKTYLIIWGVALIIALLHITFFQDIFANMTDDHGAIYLNSTDQAFSGKKGFRFDFVIYSAAPVVVGYYARIKYGFRTKMYTFILNMYLLINAIWMLCMYAEFTNRIAYLSWFMYPVVLTYPSFRIKDPDNPLVRNRNTIIAAHLGFTLFMTFVYYS